MKTKIAKGSIFWEVNLDVPATNKLAEKILSITGVSWACPHNTDKYCINISIGKLFEPMEVLTQVRDSLNN